MIQRPKTTKKKLNSNFKSQSLTRKLQMLKKGQSILRVIQASNKLPCFSKCKTSKTKTETYPLNWNNHKINLEKLTTILTKVRTNVIIKGRIMKSRSTRYNKRAFITSLNFSKTSLIYKLNTKTGFPTSGMTTNKTSISNSS